MAGLPLTYAYGGAAAFGYLAMIGGLRARRPAVFRRLGGLPAAEEARQLEPD